MHETELSSLIGRIYDAAFDQSLWPTVLNDVGAQIGASAAIFFLEDHLSGDVSFLQYSGYDHADELEYLEHFIDKDITLQVALGTPGKVISEGVDLGADTLRRSPIHQEFFRLRDADYGIGAVFSENTRMATLAYRRGSKRDFFSEKEAARLQSLFLPHFERAMKVTRQWTDLTRNTADLLNALDKTHQALLIVDGNAQILFASPPAERILNEKDGLFFRASGLTGTNGGVLSATAQRALAEAIKTATTGSARPPGARAASTLWVDRPSGNTPYQLLVAPVLDALPLPLGRQRAMVWIKDPEKEPRISLAGLRTLYDLTAREAALVRAIAGGMKPNDFAAMAGLSPDTVRWYLKRIFEKTGVASQTELLSKVFGSIATFGDDVD